MKATTLAEDMETSWIEIVAALAVLGILVFLFSR
jgi:hypothetical protein